MGSLEDLRNEWLAAWPRALSCWSPFVKLTEPRLCVTEKQAREEGLEPGGLALIRLTDQAIVVALHTLREKQLETFALEILAHEVGHHIYAPADLADQARALIRARRGLPGHEHQASMIVNLYQDLLINDRLQRSEKLDLAGVFRRLEAGRPPKEKVGSLWTLYMRIYEILWALQRGTLTRGTWDAATEGDAQLGARLVRSYAHDWLRGSGRFAALCLRYLIADTQEQLSRMRPLLDALKPGKGGDFPLGLGELDPGELQESMHPSEDPLLSGMGEEPSGQGQGQGQGQSREPFELGQVLRELGLDLTDHDLAVRYYREKALPHLIPFPRREVPHSKEPLMEGLEPWDFGSPLEEVDWLESVLVSPRVVPGVTTRQRFWGVEEGTPPQIEPIDLDLYIDSSGSMPDPRRSLSYLALAGAIVTLSALRAGSAVQATLWSGPRQFRATPGFIRDEEALMRLITDAICGSTAFPLHMLRTTYSHRTERDRPVHILVISDDGVDTMGATDEQGTPGLELAAMALQKARAGGTLVLNLWNQDAFQQPFFVQARKLGFALHRVTDWAELVSFAREFSRRQFAQRVKAGGPGS